MKKTTAKLLLIAFLCGSLTLTLSGCAQENKPVEPTTESETAKPEESSKPGAIFINPGKHNPTETESETKPAETKPIETESEAKPAEPKPTESETKPVEAKPTETKPTETESEPKLAVNSIEAIKTVCGLVSNVETSVSVCLVDINNSANPYDVIYDYGDKYQSYVKMCDWSLVFDAEFYKKAFPALAMLYHDNDALLLEHFRTVGVHEGRQGCENFNVQKYMQNSGIGNAFGENYEGYYFYYMLNYATEKNVSTACAYDRKTVQLKTIYTALQKAEYTGLNAERKKAGAPETFTTSEFCAFANFRAFVNADEYWEAHTWYEAHADRFWEILDSVYGRDYQVHTYNENTATYFLYNDLLTFPVTDQVQAFVDSPDHYRTMIFEKFDAVGVSNWYIKDSAGITGLEHDCNRRSCLFECYFNV